MNGKLVHERTELKLLRVFIAVSTFFAHVSHYTG